MDDFTQGMLERARQRREALSKKMAETPVRKRGGAQDELSPGVVKPLDINDDSPNKRPCLQEINNQIKSDCNSTNPKEKHIVEPVDSENVDTTSSSSRMSRPMEPESVVSAPVSQRGRFAALAERYKSWEDDLTHHNFVPEEKKPSKADRYRYPQAEVIQPSSSPAPLKKSLISDFSVFPPETSSESVSRNEKNPRTAKEEMSRGLGDFASKVFRDEPQYVQTSPVRLVEEEVVLPPPPTIEIPKAVRAVDVRELQDAGKEAKSHVSCMNFAIGGGGGKVEENVPVTRCNVVLPGGNRDAVSRAAALDGSTVDAATVRLATKKTEQLDESVSDEPTKKPVAARLAAWQSKVAATEEKPSVSHRVQALEKKFGGGPGNQSPKSTGRFGSPKSSSGSSPRSFPNSGSPAKSPAAKTSSRQGSVQRGASRKSPKTGSGGSPAAKIPSPGNIQPATQTMHARLAKFCESRNAELMEKSRAGRAAELAMLENRWRDGAMLDERERPNREVDPKPTATHTPNRRRSRSADSPASPHSAKSAKREETRNRLRADFEGKLRMMGFDVTGVDTASIELGVIEETAKEAKMPLEKTSREAVKPPGKSSCEVVKPPGKSSCEKNPESVGKAALTPNPGRSIYNLVKKSAGGISSAATAAPPAVDTPKRDGRSQFEPTRVRHRSAEYESGTDSFDESAEFRKPGPVDAKKPGLAQFGGPGPVGGDTRKPCVVTFSNTVQELTMSEQSESLDSGSQLSETESGTTEESTEETENSDGMKSHPDDEDEDEEGDGDVSDLLDEAIMDDLEKDCATPMLENKPAPSALPSVPQERNIETQVVMRRRSSARKPARTDDDLEPRGYISVQQYRQQMSRPKSQPPGPSHHERQVQAQKRATVVADIHSATTSYDTGGCGAPRTTAGQNPQDRNPRVGLYPDLRMELGLRSGGQPGDRNMAPVAFDKPASQRFQELQDLVRQEENVIQQTSNALNQCCSGGSVFAGSAEAVECHRLLLMSCKKRETYMLEMQRLREQPCPGAARGGPKGRLSISDIRLPLKSQFTSKYGTMFDTSIDYFIVMLRNGAHVVFTQMVSSQEAATRGSVDFPNLINIPNIDQNFVVELEVFAMSIDRDVESTTPKKNKKGLTLNKKLLTPKSSRVPPSPGGPTAVRSTNFTNVASLQLVMSHVNKTHFTLDRVPSSSVLQGSIHLCLKCQIESRVEERGFLTMFEDVSGFGAWHRRWCVLKGGFLAFWKYPDEEKDREPIGAIDLKACISERIDLVSREACARPNTFEVTVMRRQQRGDRETLVTKCQDAVSATKHWISADTKEERMSWCAKLNEAIVNLRTWHSDALRPVKPHTPRC